MYTVENNQQDNQANVYLASSASS